MSTKEKQTILVYVSEKVTIANVIFSILHINEGKNRITLTPVDTEKFTFKIKEKNLNPDVVIKSKQY